jgi:regulator of protease activity HflC (stomatin/prohibitin superfamily)
MPFWFIVAIIVMGLGALFGVGSLLSARADDRRTLRYAAIAFAILGGVLLPVISAITIVPANQVGIVTNFGSWSGTRTSGMSFTAPWSTLDTFPTRNQKSIRDAGPVGEADCIRVKLKGGASACVDATVLYTIDETHAETLWRGWGSFTKLNIDLIDRSTDDAAGTVYGGYSADEASSGDNRAKITDGIAGELRKRLEPQGVRLESITLGDIHLPPDVQDRINALLTAEANLQVAKLGKEKAAAEGAAAKELQGSLTREALVIECLKTAREVRPQIMPDCGLGSVNSAQPLVGIQPR